MPLRVSDRHCIIDTETTGFRPGLGAVVEIGAVICTWRAAEGGLELVELAHWGSLCNPGKRFLGPEAEEALAVSGHSLEAIKRAGPDTEVAAAFHNWVNEWTKGRGVQFHAYNNQFDAAFLARAPWSVPAWAWGEDIMLVASNVMGVMGEVEKKKGGEYKYAKLSHAADFFAVELPPGRAHTALRDAIVAARVYEAAIRKEITL